MEYVKAKEWTSDSHDAARSSEANEREKRKEKSDSSSGRSADKRKLCTEIGKAAAEKSRGLFSAEDWQCNKCGNVNWARRQYCNVCNAAKFEISEERTGYGGGYNDRGVVEYKERSDSDSEYDEFGRLKKRKRKHSDEKDTKSKSTRDIKPSNNYKPKAPSDESSSSEENDDDEESVDSGDLSKYDLWGDDDEPVATGRAGTASTDSAQTEKRTNKHRSPSDPVPGKSSSSSSSTSTSYYSAAYRK